MARSSVHKAGAGFSGDVVATNYHWAEPIKKRIAITSAF